MPLAHAGDDWSLTWSPALVEPSLADGETLDATTQVAQRGEITDAAGKPIVTERPVVRVGIDRTLVEAAAAPTSARRLAAHSSGSTRRRTSRRCRGQPRRSSRRSPYRATDVPPGVDAGLAEIPGGHAVSAELALAPTRLPPRPSSARSDPSPPRW